MGHSPVRLAAGSAPTLRAILIVRSDVLLYGNGHMVAGPGAPARNGQLGCPDALPDLERRTVSWNRTLPSKLAGTTLRPPRARCAFIARSPPRTRRRIAR